MQSFFSWLTSQSAVSLLVAMVALLGVLVTTGWNNYAAEKRGREDQAAADLRRQDDQAAEDSRRKNDEDRREQERLETMWREDLARQRTAVIKCIKSIRDAEIHFQNVVMEKAFADPEKLANDPSAQLILQTHKATSFADFYHACLLSTEELILELTHSKVRAWAIRLRKKIISEYNAFDASKQQDLESWISWATTRQALSTDVQVYLNGLKDSAFQHLHPFPTPDGMVSIYGDGISGMPDIPKATRPGTYDRAMADRRKDDKTKR